LKLGNLPAVQPLPGDLVNVALVGELGQGGARSSGWGTLVAKPSRSSPSTRTVMLPALTASLLRRAVMICRDPARGRRRAEAVRNAGPGGSHRVLVGDLADPDAVRALTAQVRKDTDQLHALVHTAAALTQHRRENRVGQELMFATNLLGRFLLTDHRRLATARPREPSPP